MDYVHRVNQNMLEIFEQILSWDKWLNLILFILQVIFEHRTKAVWITPNKPYIYYFINE